MKTLDRDVEWRAVGVPNSYIPVVLLGIVAALNIISTVLALLAL